jgi:hypothetical protein
MEPAPHGRGMHAQMPGDSLVRPPLHLPQLHRPRTPLTHRHHRQLHLRRQRGFRSGDLARQGCKGHIGFRLSCSRLGNRAGEDHGEVRDRQQHHAAASRRPRRRASGGTSASAATTAWIAFAVTDTSAPPPAAPTDTRPTLTGEGDDGDRRDDDDAVHDQRPRPRLPCPDPGAAARSAKRGERQPERSGGDEHRPRDRRHHRPAPPSDFDAHHSTRPPEGCGSAHQTTNHPTPPARRCGLRVRAGWLGRRSARRGDLAWPEPAAPPQAPAHRGLRRAGCRSRRGGRQPRTGPGSARPHHARRPTPRAASHPNPAGRLVPDEHGRRASGAWVEEVAQPCRIHGPTECAAMSATARTVPVPSMAQHGRVGR